MRVIRYCELCGKRYASKHQAKAIDMARACCAEAKQPIPLPDLVVPIEAQIVPPLTTRSDNERSERAQAITAMVRAARLPDVIATQMIADGVSLEEAQKRICAALPSDTRG